VDFREKYQYRIFKILCTLVGKKGIVESGMSYKRLGDWLIANKHNLFGYCVCTLNESWDASNFLRYETNLAI